MEGANEVGEVKVSRLQMEGETEDRAPPEHKKAVEELPTNVSLIYLTDTAKGALKMPGRLVIEEMKKKKPNTTLVSQMMDQTFPLCRRQIVTQEPVVQSMVERWPGLFTDRQTKSDTVQATEKFLADTAPYGKVKCVRSERHRVYVQRLPDPVKEEWHQARDISPIFTSSKRAMCGVPHTFKEAMESANSKHSPDVTALRSVVLKGLPIVLGDDSSEVYKTCFVSNIERRKKH
ncbi:hypothetical protein L3Q82_016541 [Scortum barcoo]|uniref:Uncharacterized protein n=1 Tax=Scortum barcoo TaxID=214431 RepID=A0ACB8X7J1_9TELE|nr:hypothetical protein L3Q82_016541 [Scortum barcoo]